MIIKRQRLYAQTKITKELGKKVSGLMKEYKGARGLDKIKLGDEINRTVAKARNMTNSGKPLGKRTSGIVVSPRA